MATQQKGALNKTPTNKQQSLTPTRPENLAMFNTLTPEQQKKYQEIRKTKGVKIANSFLQRRAQKPATGPLPYDQMTREQQIEQGFEQGGQAYGDIVNRFRGFDPSQMQGQYEPQFQQEMDRYRQNIMGQFERRNAEEFERQNVATQQQIAERGLDPNSPAAQALMKQNTQRQDLARQEAMSAAETGAYGIQEQAFGQAYKQQMLPYQMYEAIQQPYAYGTQAYYQQQQLQQQQEFEAKQNQLNRQAQMRIAGMNRGGGGGGGDPTDSFYDRQMPGLGFGNQPQPNPIASGTIGVLQGVGSGIQRQR